MIIFKSQQSMIGQQLSLRLDTKYREFWDQSNNQNSSKFIRVGDIIQQAHINKITKQEAEELDESVLLLDISVTEPKYGTIETSLYETDNIGSDKNILSDADFIVSKICMSKGYIFNKLDEHKEFIGSTELIPYMTISKRYSLSILRTVLLNNKYLEIFRKLETGKTPSQKRVSPFEFMEVRVPEIPQKNQAVLQGKIEEQESEISELKGQIAEQRNCMDEMINALL